MKTAKFARERWEIDPVHPSVVFVMRRDTNPPMRMNICDAIWGRTDEESKANTLLIGAGPEMYSQLEFDLRNVEAMIYTLPVRGRDDERRTLEAWAARIREILEKARG